jgi:hypothetical protein
MKNRTLPFILFLFLLTWIGCRQDSASNLQELDLMSEGMPIVIYAPADAKIKRMDLVLSKDITVIKDQDFHLQIFESNADVRDPSAIKSQLLDEIKLNPYFSTILKDDTAGFLYETRIDSNYINYGFRHVRIQGDKEYIFQQGLGGKFTREAVELMYKAVQ